MSVIVKKNVLHAASFKEDPGSCTHFKPWYSLNMQSTSTSRAGRATEFPKGKEHSLLYRVKLRIINLKKKKKRKKKKKKHAWVGLMPARKTERNAGSKSKERMDEG